MGSGSSLSDAVERLPRLLRPLFLAPSFAQNDAGEGGGQNAAPPRQGGNRGGLGVVRALFRVPGRILGAVQFLMEVQGSACSVFAGPATSPTPPGRGRCPTNPGAPATSIGGYGRAPGATTEKYRVAGEFDSYVVVNSAGSRGWTTATPDDVFGFLCYLDTQGTGTKMVHESPCPGVGRKGDDACLEGSSCAKR